MNLSPSAWLEDAAPTLLAIAAVTLACLTAFALVVHALLRVVLRRRWLRDAASSASEQGDLSGFTWTSTAD
ncbi:hypothetical protein OG389_30975 [Streptomyces sp. NBC_00435]|uniref:hypothetical protein n=1 Tax=Streptomyces sp. NBC_00435 TaxID=2903649 RepID=UPI002E2028C2